MLSLLWLFLGTVQTTAGTRYLSTTICRSFLLLCRISADKRLSEVLSAIFRWQERLQEQRFSPAHLELRHRLPDTHTHKYLTSSTSFFSLSNPSSPRPAVSLLSLPFQTNVSAGYASSKLDDNIQHDLAGRDSVPLGIDGGDGASP